MARQLWTDLEIVEIITDGLAVEEHVRTYLAHIERYGTPIPMRTSLGHWELMRLDQLAMVRDALTV